MQRMLDYREEMKRQKQENEANKDLQRRKQQEMGVVPSQSASGQNGDMFD